MRRVLFLISISLILVFSGCSIEWSQRDGSKYTTEARMNDLEYSSVISEHVIDVQTLIQSRMIMAKNVTDSTFPYDEEIVNTDSVIKKIENHINTISSINPPYDREENKGLLLTNLVNAKNTMIIYEEALETKNSGKIKQCAEMMKNDFEILTSSY